jgi:hypothetical protein
LHIADSNNKNNKTTPMFLWLNKTTQVILKQLPNSKYIKFDSNKDHKHYRKHGRHKGMVAQERIKIYVPKQMYFKVNDENATAFKYFDLRTSAVWLFKKLNSRLRMVK